MSSEHIKPTAVTGAEITFLIPKEEAYIPLKLRRDALEDLEQYEVDLEIMRNGERKIVGSFGICRADIESQHYQKIRLRKLDSKMKSFPVIEIKYKVFEGRPTTPLANTNVIHVTANNGTDTNNEQSNGNSLSMDKVDSTSDGPLNLPLTELKPQHLRPHFRKNSCIVVLGTTGRGKTTTMNLFTGNTEPTGNASHSTTKSNRLYGDKLPEHTSGEDGVGYPVWLDTVGLDESDADVTNGDLVRSYLRVLQCYKIEWVHAVVWCITPEDKVEIVCLRSIKKRTYHYFTETTVFEGSS